MSQNSFSLPAFAKINWFLRVFGKREDGFHEIYTAFQTVSLCDKLTFSEHDEILLTCDVAGIPVDESNLIVRAARLLQESFQIKKGARVHLEKKIPSPGGLGGGSSNAAVALMGLTKLWKLKISVDKFSEIGRKLGSDVPFFFYGGTAAGTGRGTEIEPVEDIAEKHMLIVTPDVSVSTADAYRKLGLPCLTNSDSKSILKLCFDETDKLKSKQLAFKNDFERVVFQLAPEIERVKKALQNNGAKQVLMSGSGASVFAVFENEETRQATMRALENDQTWRQFVVATISRKKYREAFEQVPTVVSN